MKEYLEGVKGIIFDYGGTLDSRGDHWSEVIFRGWQKVLGGDIDRELFRAAYVEGERAMARERIIMPEDDFRTTLYKKLLVELKYYRDNVAGDALGLKGSAEIESAALRIADECDSMARECVEEARPVLEKLKERYPMVLVSNFYGNVESVLSSYDLSKYFKAVVESAVVGVRKPDPAIFRLGVEALGMAPEEVVVIGDTFKKDILPALSLGCKAIWLKGKGWTPADDEQDYDYIIKKLADLVDCLIKTN